MSVSGEPFLQIIDRQASNLLPWPSKVGLENNMESFQIPNPSVKYFAHFQALVIRPALVSHTFWLLIIVTRLMWKIWRRHKGPLTLHVSLSQLTFPIWLHLKGTPNERRRDNPIA